MHRLYLSSDGDYQYGLQVSIVVGTAIVISLSCNKLTCCNFSFPDSCSQMYLGYFTREICLSILLRVLDSHSRGMWDS